MKQAEEAEREQRQFAEALSSTAALISSTLNVDEVLDRILNQVATVNPLNTAEVVLIEGSDAYVARSRGPDDPDYTRFVLKQRFPLESTRNFREMIETGKPVLIADVLDYPGWVPVEAAPWIRSAVGAPIRLEGETIGFLSITSDQAGAFTEQHATNCKPLPIRPLSPSATRGSTTRCVITRASWKHRSGSARRNSNWRTNACTPSSTERARAFSTPKTSTIQFANLAFCKLMGYDAGRTCRAELRMLLYSAIPTEDEIQRLNSLREAVQTNQVWRGELPDPAQRRHII